MKTGKVQVPNNQENQLAEVREVYLTPGEKGTLFKQTSVLEKSANTDPNFQVHLFIYFYGRHAAVMLACGTL